MKWFLKVFRQYADFEGRACREEYWMFVLFNIIFSFVISLIGVAISFATNKTGAILLSYMYMFAVLIPGLAVTVRRLHDTGRSAWFILVNLIPFVGGIWLFVVLVLDGTTGKNRYGRDPKEVGINKNFNRNKSVAVALIISSITWMLTLIMFYFTIMSDPVSNLFIIVTIGLAVTGIILLSNKKISDSVAYSLIISSGIWLLLDIYFLKYGFMSIFDVINKLVIIIPVALVLFGIFILQKKMDKSIPAYLLIAGSCIWILTKVFYATNSSFRFDDTSDYMMFLSNSMGIMIPVFMLVLAQGLLSGKRSPLVYENGGAEELKRQDMAYSEKKNDLAPEKETVHSPSAASNAASSAGNVTFIREDKDNNSTWKVYKAPCKADAMAFLSKQNVVQPSYYVVVETPEGNFGRDINGFYQE